MKKLLLACLCFSGLISGGNIYAEEEFRCHSLFTPDMVDKWDEISEKMMKWEIAEFRLGGQVAHFKVTDNISR